METVLENNLPTSKTKMAEGKTPNRTKYTLNFVDLLINIV
jgi:hypothetical protein